MSSDRARQLLTVVTYLVMIAVNVAANALPINGQLTAEISDRFSVYVVPAGYVFAIWGLIYLLLGAFTVWQALPRNREDGALRAIGWLPVIAALLNASWVLLFQYELFVASVAVIVALLLTLIAIHLRLWARRDAMHGTRFWVVRVPFSVYLGWITVATIANIAQTLSSLGFDAFGIDPVLVAVLVLLAGLAIAARFVTEFRDAAYGLVIVWAYAGIMVKELGTVPVAAVAGLGALLIAFLVVAVIVRRGDRTGAAVPHASPA